MPLSSGGSEQKLGVSAAPVLGAFLMDRSAWVGGSRPEPGRAHGLSWIYTSVLPLSLRGWTLFRAAGVGGVQFAFLFQPLQFRSDTPSLLPPGAAFARVQSPLAGRASWGKFSLSLAN